jgi:hypothetical protein
MSTQPFAMVVQQTIGFGGVQVAGTLISGDLPTEGTRVIIVQEGQRQLMATVSNALRLDEPARVHVGLAGVTAKDVLPGARIATDPRLLDEPLPPELRPALAANPTSDADQYADYSGLPLHLQWLHTQGVDFDITVQLDAEPTAEQRAALERAVQSWYGFGVDEGWPGAFSGVRIGPAALALERTGQGHLHSLHGPTWQGRVARWRVDSGSAPADAAVTDLARRLAGWSATWNCPVEALVFGGEPL